MACSSSARKTLACAIRENIDAIEARIHAYAASAPSTSKRDAKRAPLGEPPLSKRQKKAAAKAAKAAVEAEPKAGAGAKKPKADGKKKQTDGLERMDGGNPAGPPCRNFAKGTCNGPCRFSHDAVAEADDEDEAD